MDDFFPNNNYSINSRVGYPIGNVEVNAVQQAPENNAIEQNPANVPEAGGDNRQIENPNAVKPQWQARLDKMLMQAAQKRNPYVNTEHLQKTMKDASKSIALTQEQRATIDNLKNKVIDSLKKLDNIKLQDLLKVASLKDEDIQDEQLKNECSEIRQTISDACNAQTELAKAIRLIGNSVGQQKILEKIEPLENEQDIQNDNSIKEFNEPQDVQDDDVSAMVNPTGIKRPRDTYDSTYGVSAKVNPTGMTEARPIGVQPDGISTIFNPTGMTEARPIDAQPDGISTVVNPTGIMDGRITFGPSDDVSAMVNPTGIKDGRITFGPSDDVSMVVNPNPKLARRSIDNQANREIQKNAEIDIHNLEKSILSYIRNIASEHKSDREIIDSALSKINVLHGFLSFIERTVASIDNGAAGYINNYEYPLEKLNDFAKKLRSDASNAVGPEVKIKLGSLGAELNKIAQDINDSIEVFNSSRFSTQLEDIADMCDLRAFEIRTVFESIIKENSGAAHQAAGNSDVESKTFAELAGEAVPNMPVYRELVERYAERLSVPLNRLEEIENSDSDNVYSLDEINTIERELMTLQNDLSEIIASKKITLKDGTTAVLDQEILSQLKERLDDAMNRFEKFHNFFQKDFLAKVLSSSAERVFSKKSFNPELLNDNTFRRMFPNLVRYGELSNEYNSIKDKALDNSSGEIDRIKGIIQETFELANSKDCADERQKFTDFCNEIDNYKKSGSLAQGGLLEASGLRRLDYQNAVKFTGAVLEFEQTLRNSGYNGLGFIDNTLVGRSNNQKAYFCEKLVDTIDRIRNYQANSEQYRTGKIFAKAMKSKAPLSTLIEARLHGATLDMIDQVCDDSNLLEPPKELGNGQFNSVKLCTFRDENSGKIVEKVFKAEDHGYLGTINNARTGVIGLSSHQLAHLNIANEKCAKMISDKNPYVETSVGMLNGVYGMFMAKATGTAPKNLVFPNNADKNTKCELRGKLMSQCNVLQWTDLLFDQIDRHQLNYFVDIQNSADNQPGAYNVKLTAIDNDLSFTANRPSLYEIRIHKMLKDIMLPDVLGDMRMGAGVETFISGLVEKGAAKENEDGSVTFNLTKLTSKERAAVARTLGYQSFKIPDFMDEDCYNHIVGLKNVDTRNQLMDSLPVGITAEAKQCFVTRLDDMIKLAEQYKKEGKVISAEQWQDENVQFDMYNNCMSVPTDSIVPRADSEFASEEICEKYFGNDLFFRDLAYICMDEGFKNAAIEHKAEKLVARFEPMNALQQDVRIADQGQVGGMDGARLQNFLQSFSWDELQNALNVSQTNLTVTQKAALQKLFSEMEGKMLLLGDATILSPDVFQDAKMALEKLMDAIRSMRYEQLYDDSLNTSETISQYRNDHQGTVLNDMRQIMHSKAFKKFPSSEKDIRRAIRDAALDRGESQRILGAYNSMEGSWKRLYLHATNIGYGMNNELQNKINEFNASVRDFDRHGQVEFDIAPIVEMQNEAIGLIQTGFTQQVEDISAQRKSLKWNIGLMEKQWGRLQADILDLPMASQKRVNDRIKQARSLVGDIMTAMNKYDGNIENEKGNSGNPTGIEDKILKNRQVFDSLISELRHAGKEHLATRLESLVNIVATCCDNIKDMYQAEWDDDELLGKENRNLGPLEALVARGEQCANGIDDMFKAISDYPKDVKANARKVSSTLNVIEVLVSAKSALDVEGNKAVDEVRSALEAFVAKADKLGTEAVDGLDKELKAVKDSIGRLTGLLLDRVPDVNDDLHALAEELDGQYAGMVIRHDKFVDDCSRIASVKQLPLIKQINNLRLQNLVPVEVKVPKGVAGEFELVSKIVSSKHDIATNLDNAAELLNSLPNLLINRQLPAEVVTLYHEAQDALAVFQNEYDETINSGKGYIINELKLYNMLDKFSSLSNALYAPGLQGQEHLLEQAAENLDRLNVNMLKNCIDFSENMDGIRKYISLSRAIKSAKTEVVNQKIPVLRRYVDGVLATLEEVPGAFNHISDEQEKLIGEVTNAFVEFIGEVAKIQSGERDIVNEQTVENVKGSVDKLANMLNGVNKELGDKLGRLAGDVLRHYEILSNAMKPVIAETNQKIWSEMSAVSIRLEDLRNFEEKASSERRKFEGDIAHILNGGRPDTLSQEMLNEMLEKAQITLSRDQKENLFSSRDGRRSVFEEHIQGKKLDEFSWLDLMYVFTDKLEVRLEPVELHRLHKNFDLLISKPDQDELSWEKLDDMFGRLEIKLGEDEAAELQKNFENIDRNKDEMLHNDINDIIVKKLIYNGEFSSGAWKELENAIELRHKQVDAIRSILTRHQEENETYSSLVEMLDRYDLRTSELENIHDTISGYTANYFNALNKIDQLSEFMTEIGRTWKPNNAQRQMIAAVNNKLERLRANIWTSEKNVWDYKDDVNDNRIRLRNERFSGALDYLMCVDEDVKFNSGLIKDVQAEILNLAGAMRNSSKEDVRQKANTLAAELNALMKIHKNLGENVKGRLSMKKQAFGAQMYNDRRQLHGKKEAFTKCFGESIGILNGAAGNPPVQKLTFARMETVLDAFQKLNRSLKQLQDTGKLQLEDGTTVDFSDEFLSPSFKQLMRHLNAQRITSYNWLLQISEEGRNVGLHDELPEEGVQESEIKKALRKSIPFPIIVTAIEEGVPLSSLEEVCNDGNCLHVSLINKFQGRAVVAMDCTYGDNNKEVEKVFMGMDAAQKCIAWQDFAKLLGCSDIVPKLKPSYGLRNGEFGVFFDKGNPMENDAKMQLLAWLAGLDDVGADVPKDNILTKRIQISNDGMLKIPYALQDNDFASQDEFNGYQEACRRCSAFKDSLRNINTHSSDSSNYTFDLKKLSHDELMQLQSLVGWPLVAIAEKMDDKMADALMMIAENSKIKGTLQKYLPADVKDSNMPFASRLDFMIRQAKELKGKQKQR